MGRRKESHKIKEDLLMEAANKLAAAINIAIEESDHLLRSELSEMSVTLKYKHFKQIHT